MVQQLYRVTVAYEVRQTRTKEIKVFAHNQDEAEQRACRTILTYDGAYAAQAANCERVAP